MSPAGSFTTISSRVRTELKVRNSRFIGTAVPIGSKEEANEEIARVQKEFWDASHNCYAWRLAPDGMAYRFSDDGEPSGSAGKPILFVLQQRSLLNTLVIVTRYFGGTKLGVGGLVRAYGDTASAVLDAAETAERFPSDVIRIFTPYEDMRAVRALVERYALRFEEEFHDAVRYTMTIRSDRLEEFTTVLTETSQGRAGLVKLDHIAVS